MSLWRRKGCKGLWSRPKDALSMPDLLRQLMGRHQSREDRDKGHTARGAECARQRRHAWMAACGRGCVGNTGEMSARLGGEACEGGGTVHEKDAHERRESCGSRKPTEGEGVAGKRSHTRAARAKGRRGRARRDPAEQFARRRVDHTGRAGRDRGEHVAQGSRGGKRGKERAAGRGITRRGEDHA